MDCSKFLCALPLLDVMVREIVESVKNVPPSPSPKAVTLYYAMRACTMTLDYIVGLRRGLPFPLDLS